MCGIAGIVTRTTDIDPTRIQRMTKALQHRGPDDFQIRKLSDCHLGHTRLSVIDAVGGAQPMCDPSERFWLVFNGEIFNYVELRTRAQCNGWRFRTDSDTEVLLATYVQQGEGVVNQLNGQFAFAIWDSVDHRLFAARDRFGEKPFYFAMLTDHGMMFGSELRALLASDLIVPHLDLASVDAFLSLLYVPPSRCIYNNIEALPPAHAITWRDGVVQKWRYWQPSLSTRDASVGEVTENVRLLLAAAVKRQMVADVPLGAFLSGGIDSATIVALMSKQTNKPVETFSVGFGDMIDELPYAREVAQLYGTKHHELQVAIPVAETIERMADVFDEPFADSSNVPTYCIAEVARKHVTVALSGDGGDELFGGYDWYSPWVGKATTRASLAEVATRRVLLWGAIARRQLGCSDLGSVMTAAAQYQAKRLTRRFDDVWASHLAMTSRWWEKRSQLWGIRESSLNVAKITNDLKPPSSVSGIDRLSWFDLTTYLPGDILVKVDRASMAHSLESRAPFLDTELSEYVLSLPASIRFVPGKLKSVLRDACSDLWPPAIRNRRKQGFGAPIQHWIEQPAVAQLWARVTASNSPLCELLPGLQKRSVRESMKAQQQWTLLQLGLWLEKRTSCLANLS